MKRASNTRQMQFFRKTAGRNKFISAMLFWVFFLANSIVKAQTSFQTTYGGPLDDAGVEVKETADGFIIGGLTRSFGSGNWDYYLVKTSKSGNILWSKTYGGSQDDICNGVQVSPDGGYVMSGFTNSFGSGGFDAFVVKASPTGAVQWSRAIGGFNNDYFVTLTGNGEYLLTGTTKSFGSGDADIYLCKLDNAGNLQWSKAIGGTSQEWGFHCNTTSDGGFIITGVTLSFGTNNDFYVMKIDSIGNIQWTRTFGGTASEEAHHAEQTTDGGYIIAGFTESFGAGGNDVMLVKTDANGNLQWSRTFGGAGNDYGISVKQTSDGGYIASGWTESFGFGSSDAYVIKTDAGGNVEWTRTYGGSGADYNLKLIETADSGFILASQTTSFGAGGNDVYLIKTDGNGLSGCNENLSTNTATATAAVTVSAGGVAVSASPAVIAPVVVEGTPGTVSSVLCLTGLQIDSTIHIIAQVFEDSISHIIWNTSSDFSVNKYFLEIAMDGINYSILDSISTDSLSDIHGLDPDTINIFSGILYSTESGNNFIFNHVLNGYIPYSQPIKYRIRRCSNSACAYSNESEITRVYANINGSTLVISPPPKLLTDCPPVQSPPVGWFSTGLEVTSNEGCCVVTYEFFQEPGIITCGIPICPAQCNLGDCVTGCGCTYDPCCCHLCSQFGSCSCIPWIVCLESNVQWVITSTSPKIADQAICPGQSATLTVNGSVDQVYWFDSFWNQIDDGSGLNFSIVVSPNSTTTYQALIVYADGTYFICPVTVTVLPLPPADAGPDVTICEGTNTQLLASGGVNYSWEPASGLNNPSISNPFASPVVTTFYTVTVTDANGCTDVDDVTVFVLPKPLVGIEPDASAITCDNSVVYSVVPVITGATYQWSATNGTVTCVNAACTTATVIWTDQTSDGTVSVTVTLINGCTNSTTLKAEGCCIGNPGDITVSNMKVSDFCKQFNCTGSGNIADPYVFTNNFGATGLLYINGEFTVDKALEFRESLIKMGTGAKIIIPSTCGDEDGLLNVICTNIEAGCNEMWNGIWVYPDCINDNTTQLFMDGGTLKNTICPGIPCTTHYIRDAENAVVSVDGGKFELYCYKYLNNYKDVWVQTYTTGIHPSSGLIQSCTFITDGGLIPPRSGQRGHFGVEITQVDEFTVGMAGADLTNTFDNLDIGLRDDRSNVTVKNNIFQNIIASCFPVLCFPPPPCKPSLPCPVIACIYATGLVQLEAAHTLTVGSASDADKNIFQNSSNGIWVEGSMNMSIKKNQFINMNLPSGLPGPKRCIYSIGQLISNIEISTQNHFKRFVTGIFILDPLAINLDINNNHFNLSTDVADVGGTAILLQTAIANNFVQLTSNIKNNIIRRIIIGIRLTNYISVYGTYNTYIYRNSIFDVPSNASRYGIWTENSPAFIDLNSISFNGPSPTANQVNTLRGIQVNLSPFTVVTNNTLTKMGSGIRFIANSNPSFIKCNIMNFCYNGVHLEGATIGTQGNATHPQDNQWKNMIANGKDVFSDLNGQLNIPWYHRPSPAKFDPNPFTVGGINPFTVGGNPPYTCSIGCVTPDPCKKKILEGMAKAQGQQFQLHPAENVFFEKEHVFRELKSNPSLMQDTTSADTVLQLFYDSVQYTPLENIVAVEEALANNDTALAMQKCQNITPQCLIDENYKKAYDVYIRTWAIGKYEIDSTDFATLLDVAVQNVFTGGRGVYTARVMLGMHITDSLIDDSLQNPGFFKTTPTDPVQNNNIAGENKNEDLKPVTVQQHQKASKLYPNPSNGTMQMDYILEEGEEGYLVIYNILGKSEIKYSLVPEKRKLIINEMKLNDGIYFYTVIINNNIEIKDNLLIIR